MTDLSPSIQATVSQYFRVTEDTFVRDLKDAYPELRFEELVWVVDDMTGRALVIGTLDGRVVVLSDLNYSGLNAAIKADSPTDEIEFDQLIDWLKLIYDPRILVCDPDFADQPEVLLDSYTAEGGGKIAELLSLCAEVQTVRSPDGTTQYTFRVLDYSGAIREVSVSVTAPPCRISKVNVAALTMEGRFYFADEF